MAVERAKSGPLRVGIVGAGGVSKFAHIPAYLKLGSKVKLAAMCDQNLDSAKSISNKFSIPTSYSDIETMLSKENLDLVDICTPPRTHFGIATEAISKNANVLLEKPMAMTKDECDKIVSQAKSMGVKLTVVHNNLFHPTFMRGVDYVRHGELGEMVSASVNLSEPRSGMLSMERHWVHGLPGGVLMETGPHAVYMLGAILGPPSDISVVVHSNLGLRWAPYDEFRIFFHYPHSLAQISLSYSGLRWGARVGGAGTNGVFELDMAAGWFLRHSARAQTRLSYFEENWGDAFRIAGGVSLSGAKSALRLSKYGHDAIIERFVSSIRDGSPVPVPPEDAAETVRIINWMISKLPPKVRG